MFPEETLNGKLRFLYSACKYTVLPKKKKTFGETQLKKINIIITQPSTKFYKNKYNYNYQRMTSIGQETHW